MSKNRIRHMLNVTSSETNSFSYCATKKSSKSSHQENTNVCECKCSFNGLQRPSAQTGRLTGVCFRMYTEKEGLRLGLVGWVKNTYSGTVVGQVQGPADMVEEMKVWLSKEGSPSSRITRASFKNQRSIDKLELSGFKTRF
uniref:acylphosphatase n=1 Tax=Seriola dumerili TaxID=41447 RepID=A0A3B4UID6_SERDU